MQGVQQIIWLLVLLATCVNGNLTRLQLVKKLLAAIDAENDGSINTNKEFSRISKSSPVFESSTTTDRIDLVLRRDSSWPQNPKIAINYWEKGNPSTSQVALDETPFSTVYRNRLPSGDLAGNRGGVVIQGLQPGTWYEAEVLVYSNSGSLISSSVREYLTKTDRKLMSNGEDLDKDILRKILRLLDNRDD